MTAFVAEIHHLQRLSTVASTDLPRTVAYLHEADVTELYSACHAARASGDVTGLTRMFARIFDTDPAYDF